MNKLEEAANAFAYKHGFRVPYNVSGREITNDDYYDKVDLKASKDGFLAGAEWQKNNMWISIDDRHNAIPNDKDILIRMENGEVRRYNEDWESEFAIDGIVTHWMPIPEIKKGE